MSIEARQIQETLHSYAAILNFTPSPQGLRAKFGACSVQNAQLFRGPRYRKKPPARAANQIAGNHKITLVVHK